MALYNWFGKIKVRSYSIDQRDVLGQGAFGVVFKGTDAKKNTIAAKRIDGKKHPTVLTQHECEDLNRLLQLDHPNVLKILDIERNENIVWMMMPLCKFDLNEFYKTRELSYETNLEVMKQLAAGIYYLHSRDIVHRDIKPGNILVAFENPLQLLLADFDVSKCLDPEVETSLMTSNVGTLAFKAPEFFQRTSPGKIEYHRNVDIYAAGLTFLAVLQGEKGKKMLIPQIETPMDDSEFYVQSIGQLIAERIKYKVPELSIVKVEGAQPKLKRLISQMTCVNPEERLSAERVLYVIHNLESVDADQKAQKINLICEGTFEIAGLVEVDVNDKDQILARTRMDNRNIIKVMNRLSGEVSSAFPSECDHWFISRLAAHPTEASFVLECCSECCVIRNYNIHSGQCSIVYKGTASNRICHGPTGSILASGRGNIFGPEYLGLSILKWDKEHRELRIDKSVGLRDWLIQMCYSELCDMFVGLFEFSRIKGVNLKSETDTLKLSAPIWKLSRAVDGCVIKPDALTSDKRGNVFVGDGVNNRILKINSFTGTVQSIFHLEEGNKEEIRDLFWSDTEPNLIVVRGNKISTYCIPKVRVNSVYTWTHKVEHNKF